MSRQLWLHIGMHKTGTSALQRFFCINADAMRRFGHLYPMAGRSGRVEGHHLLAHGIEHTHISLSSWDELYREADESECENLIVSSEDFEFRRDRRYRDKVEITREKCDSFATRIVVYLRRQDQFVQSAYLQNLRTSRYTGSLQNLIETNRSKFDYYEFLAPWRECFGPQNIVVRIYEEARTPGGIFLDFTDTVGLPREYDWLVPEGRINPAVPSSRAGILRVLNMLPITDAIRRRLIWRLSRHGDSDRSVSSHDMLSASDRTTLLQKYESSNQRVAIEYLGRSDGKLFDSVG